MTDPYAVAQKRIAQLICRWGAMWHLKVQEYLREEFVPRAAQGTEARSDETEGLGPKGDGPAPQGCAQTPPESPHHDK